jgi:dolichyl-phosphate-mannose--protein O-mannosyl transferase
MKVQCQVKLDFDLKLTKLDILTIVLLSVLFFGMAAYNLGETNYPVTNWQSTTQSSFYVDLGSSQQVQNVFVWVKSGNASAAVYSGSPGNWSYIGNYSLQSRATDYSVQPKLELNVNTQYLRFDIKAETFDSRPNFSNWGVTNPTDKDPSPYIEISEIGVESASNTQIPITEIISLNGSDSTLNLLIDEQNSLEIQPTYMSKMYFDEVYFARAAEDYVQHVFPLERTHPPLGKLIQALGILAFGETPFGWRIMGVLFGTLMVPLMYLIGKKLFGTWIGGFSASFLFTFDFMHFTMARIGTVDTYVVFFSLMTQLFFLVYFMSVRKKGWRGASIWPLFLAVVFAALGFSTKWFSLFGAIGMLALLFALRLKEVKNLKASLSDKYVAIFSYPFFQFLLFIGVFALIYFATYIPEMLMGDSFGTILSLQNAMFSFHAGTVTDTSAAPWWTWPFMFNPAGGYVPKWFDITYLPNSTVSTISAFGNPAIWWVGFIAMVVLAIKAFHIDNLITKRKLTLEGQGWDIAALFIVVVFGFSWLIYVFIGRATYIYHYYLSVPLICLAITYFINKIWAKPWGKAAAIALFAAAVVMFLAFYPVISGAPVASNYVHQLKWFPSWFFAP